MNTKIFKSMISAACVLALAGCPASDDGGGSGSADGTGSDGTEGATEGMSMESTAPSGTSMGSMATSAGTMTATTATTGTDPLPNGSMCSSNEECESMLCFVVGVLGGICGECLTDADCPDGGCSIPNPLATPPEGATCNTGMQGEGCMTDEVCADGQVCAEILSVPGVISASTCSDCNDDSECTAPQLCDPTYDVLDLSGFKTCVDPGTVADGEGCDFAGSGDEACMNQCAIADVMGLLQLGVCSPCECDDYDMQTGCVGCDMGTCAAPAVDLAEGLVSGSCT